MARKPTHKKTSFDLELVRAAAARRWPEILARLSGHDLELFDGQHHPCPKCGGTDRFRLIDADAGALLCNQCFREKNGDGFAAAQWLLGGIDFKTALERIAEYLGIEPSASSKRHSKTNADPAKDLKFLPWHEGLAETWCVLHKPGIKPAAMVAAGCRLARYRDRFTVFALPVYGPKLAAAAPVGWCLYNVSGSTLPVWRDDGTPSQVKIKTTFGSIAGIMGPIQDIVAADTIWKVEGVSDMLAFLSLDDLSNGAIAITNANGAGERPPWWFVQQFTDKRSYVLHDADMPGENGAVAWSTEIAKVASQCSLVRLPYAVSETSGMDLRDFFGGR